MKKTVKTTKSFRFVKYECDYCLAEIPSTGSYYKGQCRNKECKNKDICSKCIKAIWFGDRYGDYDDGTTYQFCPACWEQYGLEPLYQKKSRLEKALSEMEERVDNEFDVIGKQVKEICDQIK